MVSATHPYVRIEDIKDRVGAVPLRLLQLAPDFLAARGAEHGDLLPGHGGAALLHRHRRERRHVRQRLLPLHGGVAQHLRVWFQSILDITDGLNSKYLSLCGLALGWSEVVVSRIYEISLCLLRGSCRCLHLRWRGPGYIYPGTV